jgi:hypothetical protein
MRLEKLRPIRRHSAGAVLINTAYIAAFASPTIFYMGNVVLHLALGVALAIVLLWFIRRMPLAGSAVSGRRAGGRLPGGPRQHHAAPLGAAGPHRGGRAGAAGSAALRLRHTGAGFRNAYVACLALLVVFPASTALYRRSHPDPDDRIRNPTDRANLHERGRRRSAVAVLSLIGQDQRRRHHSLELLHGFGGVRRCHKDIYQQWKSSMHHFASFNNQFYRKSIEYMQSVVGTQPSKWCAGLPRSRGLLQWPLRPAHQGTDRHAGSAAGLSCTSCHAITHVDSSMGNAGFTMQYPPLHELLAVRTS